MYELPYFFAIDHDTLPTPLKFTKLSHRHFIISHHILDRLGEESCSSHETVKLETGQVGGQTAAITSDVSVQTVDTT